MGNAHNTQEINRMRVATRYRKREDREAAQVKCRECDAPAGERCKTRWGTPRQPHPIRRRTRRDDVNLPAAS